MPNGVDIPLILLLLRQIPAQVQTLLEIIQALKFHVDTPEEAKAQLEVINQRLLVTQTMVANVKLPAPRPTPKTPPAV